ncbi:hypothetical protein [Sporofaciens musculi]|uniref:hypothetical protein n=1 Tax=Sporofaciens musculi TaxID=2681861 RepID=UPI002586DDFF|nr:hypothetical protein [Sporofaciens musculi]
MIIKFQDMQYELISKIKTTVSGNIDLYLACDVKRREEGLYTVACVRDMEIARKLIMVTTKQNVSLSFRDLHASFNADGKYYVIFNYAQGRTLQQALEDGKFNLRERLQIMKNIFAQIFLLNMPECFLYEALRKENIIVDDSLGVRFNYFFTEIDYYWQVQEKELMNRVNGLVHELFARELEKKSSRELMEFALDLDEGCYGYLWDCYVAYDEVYETVLAKTEQREPEPGRIWWRAWEKLKKFFPTIRTALAAALIVSAAIYLLWNLPNPALTDNGVTFGQIGTLEIKEKADKP